MGLLAYQGAVRHMKQCVIDGCDKPARSISADWCKMHYHRWYRHGDPLAKRTRPVCSSLGCNRWVQANGLCPVHRRKQPDHICTLQDCGKQVHAKGLCSYHYRKDKGLVPRGRKHKRRARTFGVEYEPVNALKVYERDRWRCGICAKRVNKNAKWPDQMCPSLDHIIPMSRGGDHTYANTQCSHWICNVLKSNGGSGEQLALAI